MEIKDIISSGLLELYVSGLASEQETLQVEQWALQYPEVKIEIEELQLVMENYALSAAIEPDKSVKEKIFSRIRQDETVVENTSERISAKVIAIPPFYKWSVAASIILLLGSFILSYIFYNKYQTASKDLQVAQQELVKLQQLAEAMNKDMNVMTDKNAVPVVLNGTEKAPDALAKIFWMKNTGDVYVDPTNLPNAPIGMQYQLWAIVDGKPVDAGMISTKKGIYHIQKMKSFGKVDAFAITLEKEGGNPTPKGEMIVQAKI